MRRTCSIGCGLGAFIIVVVMIQGVWAAGIEMSGDVSVSGTLSTTAVTGDGSGLTNIPGTAITNASITQSKLAGSAVGSSQLQTNAVTPAKVAFYGRVGIVATSGGDYTDPATAMKYYTDWCKTPSEQEPCLLKIMPGVYDVKTSPVVMQPYIDIEGSGQNSTIIRGAIDSSTSGVVRGASNAELRFLAVQHEGGGLFAIAIFSDSASPMMTNVTATASGGTTGSWAIRNVSSSPVMTNVIATGKDGLINRGVYNTSSSSPTMTNVTATASGVGAHNYSVYNTSSSSPTMTNVTATASGGTENYGVYNNVSASPVMTNVTATASGVGADNRGVYNESSSPTMTNVTATASGVGALNHGVYNRTSFPIMSNVVATGKDGTNNYGMYNEAPSGPSAIVADRSTFEGSTNSIYNEPGFKALIGSSKLVGGDVNESDFYSCVGVYRKTGTPPTDSYVAVDSNCQTPP